MELNSNNNRLSGNFSKKILSIEPSQTLEVDAKYKEMLSKGIDVIGFGAGETDLFPPKVSLAYAKDALERLSCHKYSPVQGLEKLREEIAKKTSRDTGLSYSAKDVLVTNGGKQALHNVLETLLNPGDEAIILCPYWTTYPEIVRLTGAKPVFVNSSIETNFKVSKTDLENSINENTKLLIFNSPSNPSGSHYSAEEIEELGEVIKKHDLWVISDDIYYDLIYEKDQRHSFLSVLNELQEKTIVINGASKTYGMTGWRLGWAVGNQEVIKLATNYQSQTTSNVSNFAQEAAYGALLATTEGELEAMRQTFLRRRDVMLSKFSEIPYIEITKPDGAFYFFPSFQQVMGKSYQGQQITTSAQLAKVVLEEAKVAFVPGEAFGMNGYGRFTYATSEDNIIAGLERLEEFLRKVE